MRDKDRGREWRQDCAQTPNFVIRPFPLKETFWKPRLGVWAVPEPPEEPSSLEKPRLQSGAVGENAEISCNTIYTPPPLPVETWQEKGEEGNKLNCIDLALIASAVGRRRGWMGGSVSVPHGPGPPEGRYS